MPYLYGGAYGYASPYYGAYASPYYGAYSSYWPSTHYSYGAYASPYSSYASPYSYAYGPLTKLWRMIPFGARRVCQQRPPTWRK